MTLAARPASPDDAPMIAQIYNEGIEDRVGTFETRPRTAPRRTPQPSADVWTYGSTTPA
jgi:L-amino acid N-acyltransferase YncA